MQQSSVRFSCKPTGFCEENPPRLEVAFEGFGPQVGVEIVGGGVGLKCPKYRILDILGAFLSKLNSKGPTQRKVGKLSPRKGSAVLSPGRLKGEL